MSGWHQKDNYVFFAMGRSGSTTLDNVGFENIIPDFDLEFKLINFYLRDKDLEPVVFIRHPLDRFYSGMFQFIMHTCNDLDLKVTPDEDQWVKLWNTFLRLLNFDRGHPIFIDNEFYHMGSYLNELNYIEKDFIVYDTIDMSRVLKDLVNVDTNKHNRTTNYMYNGVFKRTFEKTSHKQNVLNWLQPEINQYQKIMEEKG